MMRITTNPKLNPGLRIAREDDGRDRVNFLGVLAHSPAAARAYVTAESALGEGQLSRRQREQTALAMAEISGSNYCLVAHTARARDAGLTEEEITLARQATANDPKEKALLRFVQEVVLQRGWSSDAGFTAIQQAGFSDAEIVEIIANIALNLFANYLNVTVKTELDFPLLHPESAGIDADEGSPWSKPLTAT